MSVASDVTDAELSTEDFEFDGPLGSQEAKIERIAGNHFKITLGHAPEHRDWSNMNIKKLIG